MYEKNIAEPFVISEHWVVLSDNLFLVGKCPCRVPQASTFFTLSMYDFLNKKNILKEISILV